MGKGKFSHSKAEHGNTTHEQLIFFGEANATRGAKYSIFNLWLRLRNLLQGKYQEINNEPRD